MTTNRVVDMIVDEAEAKYVCMPHPLPEPGYMRAVTMRDGSKAWLRHLPVSDLYLLRPVESYPPGVGLGALRKMYA